MTVFQSLLLCMGVGLFLIGIPSLKCMALSGYEMPVYPVNSCPENETEWQKASRKRGCSEKGSTGYYHCVPTHDLSQLLEFCYDILSGRVEPGLCMILSQSSILDRRNCSMFTNGCPDKSYITTMIYQYPACLDIIGNSRCYSADPTCRNITHLTQTEGTMKMLHAITAILIGIHFMIAVIYTCITCSNCRKRIPKAELDKLKQEMIDSAEVSNVIAEPYKSNQEMNDNAELSNVKANTEKDLQKHAEDNTYTRTSAVTEAISILDRKRIVILTGKEGEGKTKTALQVMYELKNHTPLKIRNRDQWDRIVNADNPYVVCLDDVINPTSDSREFLDHIYSCVVKGKICAILVFRAKKLEQLKAIYPIFELFNPDYVIDLSSKLKLSEKEKMLKQYEKGTKMELKSTSDRDKILNTDTYFGFPFTCSLFFAKDYFFNQGPDFFRCTSSALFERIENLRDMDASFKSKVCYCVLCYILVNGSINTGIKCNLEDIAKIVGVSGISHSNTIDAVEYMKGVYLIETRTEKLYDFIHETVRETVLTSFGKLAPEMVIKKCQRDTLRTKVRTMSYKEKSGEIVLKISTEHYQILADRLLITNKEDSDVEIVVENIIVNSASYDNDFVKGLLTQSISVMGDPSKVLRLLWNNLHRVENTVLLECMLDIYGPHIGVFPPKYDQKICFSISVNDIDNIIENALRFHKRDKILSIMQYVSRHRGLHAVASFTHKQHRSMTLLHCCVLHGWEDVVNELLTFHEATVTEDLWSIFHFAAYAGRHTLVKNFQERNFVYGETAEGYSLLQCALLGLRHGSRKTTKPFLDVVKKKCVPFSLEFAAEDDYFELIKYLLSLSEKEDCEKELTMVLDQENNKVPHYLRLHGYHRILKLFHDLNMVK